MERTGENGAVSIALDPALTDESSRTQRLQEVTKQLQESGRLTGVRNELYPVSSRFAAAPVLLIERAAAPLFGIKAYGVHINGFCRKADGLHLWVARRSSTKPTWPGLLDHIAAGGQVSDARDEPVNLI